MKDKPRNQKGEASRNNLISWNWWGEKDVAMEEDKVVREIIVPETTRICSSNKQSIMGVLSLAIL